MVLGYVMINLLLFEKEIKPKIEFIKRISISLALLEKSFKLKKRFTFSLVSLTFIRVTPNRLIKIVSNGQDNVLTVFKPKFQNKPVL